MSTKLAHNAPIYLISRKLQKKWAIKNHPLYYYAYCTCLVGPFLALNSWKPSEPAPFSINSYFFNRCPACWLFCIPSEKARAGRYFIYRKGVRTGKTQNYAGVEPYLPSAGSYFFNAKSYFLSAGS